MTSAGNMITYWPGGKCGAAVVQSGFTVPLNLIAPLKQLDFEICLIVMSRCSNLAFPGWTRCRLKLAWKNKKAPTADQNKSMSFFTFIHSFFAIWSIWSNQKKHFCWNSLCKWMNKYWQLGVQQAAGPTAQGTFPKFQFPVIPLHSIQAFQIFVFPVWPYFDLSWVSIPVAGFSSGMSKLWRDHGHSCSRRRCLVGSSGVKI